MTREKALIMTLKIIDTCKKYGNEERCTQCPFSIGGCIVTDGNTVPSEWRTSELVQRMEVQSRK